jgi:hypothetical protein
MSAITAKISPHVSKTDNENEVRSFIKSSMDLVAAGEKANAYTNSNLLIVSLKLGSCSYCS